MQKLVILAVLSLGLSQTAFAVTTEQRYAQSCAVCHDSGVMQAPKKSDKTAWAVRLKQGEKTLLMRVKQGFKMMPPKGLCNDCTDAEFKALIKYMSK